MYNKLSNRCKTLNQLSYTNSILRKAIHAAVLLKQGAVIPGINSVLIISSYSIQQIAKAIVQYQDSLISLDSGSAMLYSQCGLPTQKIYSLPLERLQTPESKIAQLPAPLEFSNGLKQTEVHLKSWQNLKIESFGYCTGNSRLNGETYQVSFQKAHQ